MSNVENSSQNLVKYRGYGGDWIRKFIYEYLEIWPVVITTEFQSCEHPQISLIGHLYAIIECNEYSIRP